MLVTNWNPARELHALRERMNNLIDHALSRTGSEAGFSVGESWAPSVDIYESEENIILDAELPEVDQNDIQLKVHNNRVTLKGERRLRDAVSQKQFHRMERAFGPFTRTFILPCGIDSDKVKAEFKKGILKVTLPKRADERSTHIPIRS